MVAALLMETKPAQRKPSTRRQRRRARKYRGGAPPHRRPGEPPRKAILTESESLLTKRERKRIDNIIHELKANGQQVQLHLLDYRWWEIRRKTGWCPWWKCPKYGTVYKWWIQLHPQDRAELVSLSRMAGMRE